MTAPALRVWRDGRLVRESRCGACEDRGLTAACWRHPARRCEGEPFELSIDNGGLSVCIDRIRRHRRSYSDALNHAWDYLPDSPTKERLVADLNAMLALLDDDIARVEALISEWRRLGGPIDMTPSELQRALEAGA